MIPLVLGMMIRVEYGTWSYILFYMSSEASVRLSLEDRRTGLQAPPHRQVQTLEAQKKTPGLVRGWPNRLEAKVLRTQAYLTQVAPHFPYSNT